MSLNAEQKHAIGYAMEEIRRLRRSNEIMGAQLDVLETMRAIAVGPRQSGGMSEDTAWRLQKILEQDDNEQAVAQQAQVPGQPI